MSIANIVIQNDRALIGVDTLAGFMDFALDDGIKRHGQHVNKVSLFPHINAAMTHRGDGALTSIASLNFQTLASDDFDDAIGMMEEILEHSYQQAMATREQLFGAGSFPGAEVVLVGWSPAAGRFIGNHWCRQHDEDRFTSVPVNKTLYLPQIDRLGAVETPDTPEKMEALVRRQMDWARREHPDYACGGKLLLAELTRDAATVRTIADLDHPTRHRGQ